MPILREVEYIETKTGTKKNDTFIINDYPVLIKNSKGSDTIDFRNIDDIGNIDDLTFLQEDGTRNLNIYKGDDLLVTVENYFTTVGGTATKSSIKNILLNSRTLPYSIINDGLYDYNGIFKIKKNTIKGTVFNDTIDLSDPEKYTPTKGVTVKSGKGNDTITGSAYNDTIVGGAGENTFVYNAGSGQDKVKLTSGEDLTVYYDDSSSDGFSENEFRFYKSGKNWVLERNDDKITLVNLGKKNKTKNIKIITRYGDGKTEQYVYDLSNGTVNGERIEGTSFDKDNVVRGTLTATTIGDYIDIHDYDGISSTTNSNIIFGATIKAGTGNDTIIGSAYGDYIVSGNGNNDITAGHGYDLISLGTGANKLHYTYTDFTETNKGIEAKNEIIKKEHKKKYWYKYTIPYKENIDCVIGATSDDTLYLDGVDKENITFLKDGNNLEICFKIKNDYGVEVLDDYNAIAFVNYFKSKDKFDNIIFSGSEEAESLLEYLKSPYELGKNNYLLMSGSKTIKGLNNVNNGIVGSSKADTITGGSDDTLTDYIIGGKGNDKITGKAGTTFLEYFQGDGADTVYLTQGEKITLLYINAGEDIGENYQDYGFNITKSSDNKDIIVTRTYKNEKNKDVTDKIIFKNAANAGVGSIELKIFKSEEYVKDKYKYDVAVADYLVATVDLLHEVFGASLSMSLNSSSQTDMDSVNYDVSSFMSSTNDGIYTDTTTVPQDYTEDILVPNMDPNQGVI